MKSENFIKYFRISSARFQKNLASKELTFVVIGISQTSTSKWNNNASRKQFLFLFINSNSNHKKDDSLHTDNGVLFKITTKISEQIKLSYYL